MRISVYWLILAVFAVVGTVAADDARWWPVQKLPKTVVRTVDSHTFPGPRLAYEMMVQSVAGLAAKSVNEGTGEEMVWVSVGKDSYEQWYCRFLAGHPQVQQRGELAPWDLVDRFAKAGIIKGYILYRQDRSEGDTNTYRAEMDCSVNVATSLAGLLDGIIVEEHLEKDARAHELKRLVDVRDKTQQWCFDTYQSQLSRHVLCAQDPRLYLVRDLAIAQKALTLFGGDEPLPAAMKWLDPPSPILGWSGGDEFKATRLSTIYGHFQTATNYCMNLPVLMAGSELRPAPQVKCLDPRTIDFGDRRSGVSFVCTDGDNVQWYEGNFFHHQPGTAQRYWDSPDRGKIPFGWSCCFAQLAQLCPQAIDYALATQTANDWFVEWGGGYYYPDLFASERPDRWELLGQQARRTWELMKSTGTRIIGFNFWRYDSPDALKAYETIAGETEGMLAIFVFQYSPYEAGAGKTFWVKDRAGVEIPVITARYSIWEYRNRHPRSGTPAKVAREIRETVAATPAAELPRYDWVIHHVWSHFQQAPGNDENAEDLPKLPKMPKQEAKKLRKDEGIAGYSPAVWCAERLPESIRVVSPEELVWRIRMQHNPEQTKALIGSAESRLRKEER